MSAARIGVFGGSFDPPHLGHLILAAEAQAQLGLEKVLFVLTADPPHKRDRQLTLIDDRLAMVEAAIKGQNIFELSRIDIDRPGPHYALDTMQLLAKEYPGKELVYLFGGDSLRDLPEWHRPQDFLAACAALGVMRRPLTRIDLDDLERALPGLSAKAKLEFVDAPLLEISSSEIRERVRDGGHYRFYLLGSVYEMIRQRGLYK
ncbi:MAG: nicotinate-nucleotide adenylyltransferase [Chloroflexi bacterium]|nr:nicotinate-nucleotide adenylyltransferase [Chloroflexota bacterium]